MSIPFKLFPSLVIGAAFVLGTIVSIGGSSGNNSLVDSNSKADKTMPQEDSDDLKVATFGAGCFWCVEAVFEQLEGVGKVESGYSGGHVDNPTYKQICTGNTGHAEVCQIHYDPEKISFEELLEVFWKSHDPTTKNRQGADVGSQYRSVIFYHDEDQKKLAEEYLKKLDDAKAFPKAIVTEIEELGKFYVAEDYHQEYFSNNPYKGYCQAVIRPKVDKIRKVFADKLKKDD